MSPILQKVMAAFSEFERAIGKPEALGKAQHAIGAAIEFIEEDRPGDEKRVVLNVFGAYRRRISEIIQKFLDEEEGPEWERCVYFSDLAAVFLNENMLEDDRRLQEQRHEMHRRGRLFIERTKGMSEIEKVHRLMRLETGKDPTFLDAVLYMVTDRPKV